MSVMMTHSNKKFKAVMALKGLTTYKIADTIGVSQAAISRTLAGNRKNPRLRLVISRLLGIPLNAWKDLDAELMAIREEKHQ